MSKTGKITRRTLLGAAVLTTGAVAFGVYAYRKPHENPLAASDGDKQRSFTPYILVDAENTITIIAPRAEMGQGIHTTLAALVAEELNIPLAQAKVIHGPEGAAYYNRTMMEDGAPFAFFDKGLLPELARDTFGVAAKFLGIQGTGGSTSTIDAYDKMRRAGAAARIAFVAAAAQKWQVGPETLQCQNAQVSNPKTGKTLRFADLLQDAAAVELPESPRLKSPEEWTQLGKPQQRKDLREKVTGAPIYGIDIDLPDMLYGTVVLAPHLGGELVSADKAAALAVKGVKKVVAIKSSFGHGFGIIADNTWAAFQGAEALAPEWQPTSAAADTLALRNAHSDALKTDATFSMGNEGDAAAVLASIPSGELVSADYEVPYQAHFAMEPMNATAQLIGTKLTLWTGTQSPTLAKYACAGALGIENDDITVHTTLMGGGFGRRIDNDPALYAALLAVHTDGRPIKVTWTREEDSAHDYYRPMARARYQAHLSQSGKIHAISADIASQSVIGSFMARNFPSLASGGPERVVLDGSFDQPLSAENKAFNAHIVPTTVPAGFWRSVGYSFNAFFQQSFIDELAHAAGKDPLAFRLAHLTAPEHAPAVHLLKKLQEISAWDKPRPAGTGLGVALTASFGSWVAQTIEVTHEDGEIKLQNIWCVADLGIVLDPRMVRQQLSSAIIFGLGQAMEQDLTFSDGQINETNFDSFTPPQLYQVPPIHIELLANSPTMGGAGEPGVPPVAPALANAIYAATGDRHRSLPLGRHVAFS
ncbi:xanthine dehydrogenase family protein molybdopterin-binding subunit [Polycladidibacter hongkongensis]|uniref:xanthine dehydrogenase family protein molybdopterin-binding subunit n=1 Tax=Polycladidibacter hongkongensis TaxID=1647556 RepID=UPI000829BAF7|nr:molybdopterin cofactor-binding domain-containing protein [Pseudovibrio hongkongensis]